ncbi:interleukin-1 receptor-associated kinase 3 isoform X2 [Pyxicephalus adspersus]|uniref:interleukin-1 receptor-associated kinase 3 isoform X2 n=1 Tax=Pyxicephalus adspersus TaxID=30357 RepID=UPI003B5CD560
MAYFSPSCSTSLFDVPPIIMENFCELMDCSDGELGWRGLEINAPSPISLQEIKQGTKNFSKDFLIGEGQFFDVYKADIRKQICVVKLLKQNSAIADRQKQVQLFLTQWQCLPRIQHQNVLELLGYVRADEATCLVYPNLEHGSLFRRLHYSDKNPPLSWNVRYNILVKVAQAIHHLHTISPCPVICGNITSKNILLDQHFQPKLSDFAMVHLRSYLINHIKTIKMDHATLMFLGYLPEEYIRRGDLSVKTDVYSYGIIIMEVLSGRQAVVVNGPKVTYLREIFWEQMEKHGIDSLVQLKDMKVSKFPCSVMTNLLGVSIDSTAVRARQRPTMNEVLERIESCMDSEKFTEDQPKPLISIPPSIWPLHESHSKVPVEMDETMDNCIHIYERNETKCGQSEIAFVGNTRKDRAEEKLSSVFMQSKVVSANDFLHKPFTSRPVECSCSSGPYNTSFCEECIANGFGQDQ